MIEIKDDLTGWPLFEGLISFDQLFEEAQLLQEPVSVRILS